MKEKRELTEAEESRLRARAARDPWQGAMLLLVWRAGLTVAEAAVLRWEDVDLSAPSVTANGRMVPLEPETAAVLDRLGKERKRVFPSRRNEGEPVSRMTVNRELRLLLNEEGLGQFQPRDLKNLHILRVLEEATLEETVRVTGVEAVTLRDTWREYGRTEPLRATPAGSVRTDDQALEQALLREGDTLDGRIIRLSWQGGLYLREIRALRWADVSASCKYWYVGAERKKRPVPEGLRPWLQAWWKRGGVFVVEAPPGRNGPEPPGGDLFRPVRPGGAVGEQPPGKRAGERAGPGAGAGGGGPLGVLQHGAGPAAGGAAGPGGGRTPVPAGLPLSPGTVRRRPGGERGRDAGHHGAAEAVRHPGREPL